MKAMSADRLVPATIARHAPAITEAVAAARESGLVPGTGEWPS
jgi:hypothetical protein